MNKQLVKSRKDSVLGIEGTVFWGYKMIMIFATFFNLHLSISAFFFFVSLHFGCSLDDWMI